MRPGIIVLREGTDTSQVRLSIDGWMDDEKGSLEGASNCIFKNLKIVFHTGNTMSQAFE